jgi:putative Holliday junction resolvase
MIRKGRRLGVDVGDVRIGVASCDPDGLIASPVETVQAGPQAITRLLAIADEYEPLEFVVGLPLGLSGKEGPAAAKVRAFVAELDAALTATERSCGIRLFDERMSTMSAHANLRSSGLSSKKSRSVVDQAAAVVFLQAALDAERGRGTPPGETVRTRATALNGRGPDE